MKEQILTFLKSDIATVGGPVGGGGVGLSLATTSQIISIISVSIGLILGIVSFYLKLQERKMLRKTEQMRQDLLEKQLNEEAK